MGSEQSRNINDGDTTPAASLPNRDNSANYINYIANLYEYQKCRTEKNTGSDKMRTNSQERTCTQTSISKSKKSSPYINLLLESRVKLAQKLVLNDSNGNLLNAFHYRNHPDCPFSAGNYVCDRKSSDSVDKSFSAQSYCKDYVDNLCDLDNDQVSVFREDLYTISELSEGSVSEGCIKTEDRPGISVAHETTKIKNQYVKSETMLPFERTKTKSYAKSEGEPEITVAYERIKTKSSAKTEVRPETPLAQEMTKAKSYPKSEPVKPEITVAHERIESKSFAKAEDRPKTPVSHETTRTKTYAKSEGDPEITEAYEETNTQSSAMAEDRSKISMTHEETRKKRYAKSVGYPEITMAYERIKMKNYANSEGEFAVTVPYERSKTKSFSKAENRPETPMVYERTKTESFTKTEVIPETSLTHEIIKTGNCAETENRPKTPLAHEVSKVDYYNEIRKRSEINMTHKLSQTSTSTYAKSEDIPQVLEPHEIRKEGSLTVNYQSLKDCYSNCTIISDESFVEDDQSENPEVYVQMEELGLGFWRDGHWTPTDVIAQTIWKQMENTMPEGTIIAKWNRPSKTFPGFRQKEIIKC